MDVLSIAALALGLGLLGFIEPCSVGSHLLFIKYLEDQPGRIKLTQTAVFTVTRVLFMGLLGALAAFVGERFLELQQAFWLLLGGAYVLLGLVYVLGREYALMRSLGPQLRRARNAHGAALLGVIFGLNVPACAAPLLGAILGASLGLGGAVQGFWTLALFGAALSLPLVVFVLWPKARSWLDGLAALSERLPFWTGVVFIGLGVWAIVWAV